MQSGGVWVRKYGSGDSKGGQTDAGPLEGGGDASPENAVGRAAQPHSRGRTRRIEGMIRSKDEVIVLGDKHVLFSQPLVDRYR